MVTKMDEPIFDPFTYAMVMANLPTKTGNKVKSVLVALNSQNLPTIKVTCDDGIVFQIVFWTNHRLILQKVENNETTTLTTWTGE